MPMSTSTSTSPAQSLLSAQAVRERAHELLALCEQGKVPGWRVDRSKLPMVADYVLDSIRQNYPTLEIPFHARWRHFAASGHDRWGKLNAQAAFVSHAARGRAAYDLAIVSVLLDAGAGPDWSYVEADGTRTSRSEGLAVASIDMFAAGAFSSTTNDPYRADAARLKGLSVADLRKGFQVSDSNPLIGLEGRVHLLNALGQAVLDHPDLFGADEPRPGGLFDYLSTLAIDHHLPATAILATVLKGLGSVWPSRLALDGVPLGDTWHHSALKRSDPTNGLVPFHKLSQWLSYSLIEPLEWAGLVVGDVDGLTGLPEYRNGGLLIDLGLIVPSDTDALTTPHAAGSEFIVAWRALTVALLDEIADAVRATLNMDRKALPLAKILEGGTWAAGRRIAKEKRADSGPPLAIISDGTVF